MVKYRRSVLAAAALTCLGIASASIDWSADHASLPTAHDTMRWTATGCESNVCAAQLARAVVVDMAALFSRARH